MLQLTPSLEIGSGTNRMCYHYPNNPNLCIKVLHSTTPIKMQKRETRYFKYLHKSGVSWEYVTPLIRMEETSFGLGAVFDLVRDYDGEISKPIDFYLKKNIPEINQHIASELEEMKNYLYKQNIVFTDLNSFNILLQKIDSNQYRLKIIDGIGHNEFIPLCYTQYFGRKKVQRIWNRKFNHWFGSYDSLKDVVTPYEI